MHSKILSDVLASEGQAVSSACAPRRQDSLRQASPDGLTKQLMPTPRARCPPPPPPFPYSGGGWGVWSIVGCVSLTLLIHRPSRQEQAHASAAIVGSPITKVPLETQLRARWDYEVANRRPRAGSTACGTCRPGSYSPAAGENRW